MIFARIGRCGWQNIHRDEDYRFRAVLSGLNDSIVNFRSTAREWPPADFFLAILAARVDRWRASRKSCSTKRAPTRSRVMQRKRAESCGARGLNRIPRHIRNQSPTASVSNSVERITAPGSATSLFIISVYRVAYHRLIYNSPDPEKKRWNSLIRVIETRIKQCGRKIN